MMIGKFTFYFPESQPSGGEDTIQTYTKQDERPENGATLVKDLLEFRKHPVV